LIKLVLKGFFEDGQEKIIFEKVLIFVFNKIDVIQDEEILQELEKNFIERVSKRLGVPSDCVKQNIIKISAA
jgi:50S ribosomal subunit-associated GTPase HflX